MKLNTTGARPLVGLRPDTVSRMGITKKDIKKGLRLMSRRTGIIRTVVGFADNRRKVRLKLDPNDQWAAPQTKEVTLHSADPTSLSKNWVPITR